MKALLKRYEAGETSVLEQDQIINELYMRYRMLQGAVIGATIVAGLCWLFA
jgi:hypothetical protein|nr:MAG TPA: hypothetical protein [Caudoviricetes sp.]